MKVSVVIPIHNEEENIKPLYKELKEVLESLGTDYEIVYVNDGSTDGSLRILKELKERDGRVRVINMDRNRGEAVALTVGFKCARGDVIVTMDGDGQNDPRFIPRLLEKLEEGYSVVSGRRVDRKEPLLTRRLPSAIGNRLISLITGVKVRDVGCGLKAYRAHIPKRVNIPPGFHRFLPAVLGVKDGEVAEVDVVDRPRLHGSSHYNLKRTFEVLRELVTFPFVVGSPAQGVKTLRIALISYLFLFLVAVFGGCLASLLFSALFAAVSWVAYRNAKRFLRFQEEPDFSYQEV